MLDDRREAARGVAQAGHVLGPDPQAVGEGRIPRERHDAPARDAQQLRAARAPVAPVVQRQRAHDSVEAV
ncbi:MAG: hypothetical protein ACXVFL_10445, partial [Solirubrobacteraceae bacterium]